MVTTRDLISPGGWARALAADLLGRSGHAASQLVDDLTDVPRVLHFLHGRLEFEGRPDDIYVVSYPRSGTTWMQMLLYQLTTDGEMGFEHISQVTPWFERVLANCTRTAADLARLPAPRVFKSHLRFSWLPTGARYIYLVRDGADVALSYYHLYRSYLRFDGDLDAFFSRFLAGDLQYGAWAEHVAEWRSLEERPDVLIVEYEEMKRDLERCVRRVTDFCQLAVGPAQLARALERSSFAFMKQHEEKFDHRTRLLLDRGVTGGEFIRRGEVGDGERQLTAAQRDALAVSRQRPRRRPRLSLDLAAFLR